MSSSIRPLIRSGITQCLRQQPRTTKWQCPRQFSTAPSRAYPSMTIDPRSGGMGKARHQPRASMKVEREKMTKQVGQMNTDKLVTRDLGLLPDTMVYPRGRNKPPFLRPRLRMLFKWAKQRLVDWFGCKYRYKKLGARPGRPKINFEKSTIAPTAAEIHRQVYTAFAAGDRNTLQNLCVESILQSYMMKLAARPANRRMRWQVVKELSKPRLVSHRGAQLPFKVQEEDGGIRQCVVRLHTLQRLQSGTVKEGGSSRAVLPLAARRSASVAPKAEVEEEVEWQAPIEKEVTEYMVIQRWLIRGQEEPWVLWGYTGETTAEDLTKTKTATKKITGMQRTD